MTNQPNQTPAHDLNTSGSRYANVNPRPRTRPTPVVPATAPAPSPASIPAARASDAATDAAAKQPKTIKITVNGKLKNQPTGDHLKGYGRPPVNKQFQKGCEPGPGRSKGSKSQDTLLREELAAKQAVRVGGSNKHVTKRQLVAKFMVNGPLGSRKHADLAKVHAEACRLFPDQAVSAVRHDAYDAALDRQVLEQFLGHLQLGEASGNNVDPFADLATGAPDLGETGDEDAWSEGDWDANADGWEASDGKL